MCRWEGGGGEIPKGGRAGRSRSLGIWPRGGGARSLGIWPRGGDITGGGEILGTPETIGESRAFLKSETSSI